MIFPLAKTRSTFELKVMKIWNLIKFFFSFLILEIPVFMLMSNLWVSFSIHGLCYDSIDQIPKREVGLLLGTMKGSEENPNYYFKYRIEAAAELYHAGKIQKILASGDNSKTYYNEP